MTREMASSETTQAAIPILCFETEDVEGWLVDEGIGYFDESGMFHYGPAPYKEDVFDTSWIDEFDEGVQH